MNLLWQTMADRLRSEAAEYGRLLHLFEEQQSLLFRRDAPAVLRQSDAIEEQVRTLEERRASREDAVTEFARSFDQPPSSTLRSLLPFVSQEARPLVEALIAEVNRLVSRVRRLSRQNRLFLIRTIENHQEMIQQLRPGAFSRTYAPSGRVALAADRGASALVAEG